MKQKILLKVTTNDAKSRSKAWKIAARVPGVETISLKGDDKSQIEITGAGMDAAHLRNMLRTRVGYVEVVSVSASGGENKEENPRPPLYLEDENHLFALEKSGPQDIPLLAAAAVTDQTTDDQNTYNTELQENKLESQLQPQSLNAPLLEEMQESEEPSKRLQQIFLIINILTELLSVAFDHLSSTNKHRYALIAMLMSCVAAIMCIIELVYKAGKERAVWRWESKLPWFYYSSPNLRPFGTVLEMTELVCAIVQTILAAVAYTFYLRHVNYSFNASLLPLVLAVCLFCSKFMQRPNLEVLSKRSDSVELNDIHVKSF